MTSQPEHHSTKRPAAQAIVTALLLSIAGAGVVTLCMALFPGRLPAPQDPQVVDVVFDSRPVIWAARLLLVSAAFVLAVGGAFLVTSTIARMRNGEWLRRAGPFEVAETVVADLEDQVHLWRSAAFDYHDALEVLRKHIDETDELMDSATPESH